MWCRYVNFVEILHQKVITKRDLQYVKDSVEPILQYFKETVPKVESKMNIKDNESKRKRNKLRKKLAQEKGKNKGGKKRGRDGTSLVIFVRILFKYCLLILLKILYLDVINADDEEDADERDLSKAFITINSHYFLHIVSLIEKFGPPWRWSNFIREMLIGALKPFYKNTNYTNVEVSVFNRYKSTLFLHLIDTLKTGNAVFAPSYWAPLSELTPLFVMGNKVSQGRGLFYSEK